MPTLSESLFKTVGAEPTRKSRRIEGLFSEIQAEIAKGYTLGQIARALKDFDIDVTDKELSTYLRRIAKRKAQSANPGPAQKVQSSAAGPAQASTPAQPITRAIPSPQRKEVPASDPRFIQDILSNPPDLEQMAKEGLMGMKR